MSQQTPQASLDLSKILPFVLMLGFQESDEDSCASFPGLDIPARQVLPPVDRYPAESLRAHTLCQARLGPDPDSLQDEALDFSLPGCCIDWTPHERNVPAIQCRRQVTLYHPY